MHFFFRIVELVYKLFIKGLKLAKTQKKRFSMSFTKKNNLANCEKYPAKLTQPQLIVKKLSGTVYKPFINGQ